MHKPPSKLGAVLTASLALNLALIVWLAYRDQPGAIPPEANEPPERVIPPETIAQVTPAATPFHWRQIESQDYRTYIANLRAVGCPESTIRDIVGADLHASFADRRQKLRDEEVRLDRTRPGPGPETLAVKAAQQNLWQEEMSALTSLLNPPKTERQDESANASRLPGSMPQIEGLQSGRSERAPIPEAGELVPPLVFQGVDFAAVNLSDAEQETVEQVRQKFLEKVNGQEPSAPDYPRIWRQSQQSADELLRASVGWQRYIQIQLAIARQLSAN